MFPFHCTQGLTHRLIDLQRALVDMKGITPVSGRLVVWRHELSLTEGHVDVLQDSARIITSTILPSPRIITSTILPSPRINRSVISKLLFTSWWYLLITFEYVKWQDLIQFGWFSFIQPTYLLPIMPPDMEGSSFIQGVHKLPISNSN